MWVCENIVKPNADDEMDAAAVKMLIFLAFARLNMTNVNPKKSSSFPEIVQIFPKFIEFLPKNRKIFPKIIEFYRKMFKFSRKS